MSKQECPPCNGTGRMATTEPYTWDTQEFIPCDTDTPSVRAWMVSSVGVMDRGQIFPSRTDAEFRAQMWNRECVIREVEIKDIENGKD